MSDQNHSESHLPCHQTQFGRYSILLQRPLEVTANLDVRLDGWKFQRKQRSPAKTAMGFDPDGEQATGS